MKVINFFIVGVQKGGTTALDAMLRDNPCVQMGSRKEIHFFDDETQDWRAPDISLFHSHFDWTTNGVIRGEATPIYSYWPQAMERIAAYNPEARIVICLRHPAYRAYSHWCMETRRGLDTATFSEAIREGRSRVGKAHRIFSYVERGFYSQQIKKAKSLFRQMHFLRTDLLWTNTDGELSRLSQFLRIPFFKPRHRYTVRVDTRGSAPLSENDLAYLIDIYREDLRCTSDLTEFCLNEWLDGAYAEPMPK